MKKIENKTRLQVTFSKRRPGLFIKASELVVLCGVEIAILVQSPAGKIYAFGHPSVEAVINRLQMLPPQMAATNSCRQIVLPYDSRSKYEEAERKLEIENRRMKGNGREFCWDECCEGLELHELEEYLEALQVLRNNVSRKVVEMEKLMELKGDLSLVSSNQQLVSDPTSASSNFLALTNHDQAVDYDLFDLASK